MTMFRFYESRDGDVEPITAVRRMGDSIAGQTDRFDVWVEADGDDRVRVQGTIETVTHVTWRRVR